MAIDISQHAGTSQTLLRQTFNAQVSLPYSVAIWVNCPGVGGSAHQVWGINNNTWGNSGNGYFLELIPSGVGTFKVQAAIRRTFFGPDFQTFATSDSFPVNTWTPIVVLFDGSGLNCTSVEVYVNGVLKASGTPSVANRPQDTFPYIHVGGYFGSFPGNTGDTAFTGCLAHSALYSTLWSSDNVSAFSGGVLPSRISPGSRIYDLPMLTSASAGTASVGDDFDVVDDAPSGVITDCDDSPPIVTGGSTSVRIMG